MLSAWPVPRFGPSRGETTAELERIADGAKTAADGGHRHVDFRAEPIFGSQIADPAEFAQALGYGLC
jgi:hypothetical protein